MRCHHQRQGSAPSFSNSSQTGGGGGSGVWTLELDVDEPLDDDDDEPLDDDEDEEDDDVLSSSLSTSFFARRGLSLTPPRRGLILMPRLSILLGVYRCRPVRRHGFGAASALGGASHGS